jgi:hypothetical protein
MRCDLYLHLSYHFQQSQTCYRFERQKSNLMTVQGTDSSTQLNRSEAGDLGKDAVAKNQPFEDLGLLGEPGAPEVVLAVLILAAIGILAFAFSSCF